MTKYPTAFAMDTVNGTRYYTVVERYVDSYKPQVDLEESSLLYYQWEWDLASKLRNCYLVVDTVTGDTAYVYRGRLIPVETTFGGRYMDNLQLTYWFDKVKVVAKGHPPVCN